MGGFESLQVSGMASRLYVPGPIAADTPGVVVFHAWWGLTGDVVRFADRLAAAGFGVVAPDLYGGPTADTVGVAERLSSSMDEAAADAIALASVDLLAQRTGADTPLGAVGFSLGGAWALWSPAKRERLAASVVYYGSISGPSLEAGRVPVMGHFAESDPYEPDEGIAAFEATLRAAGREVTTHRYPGTGHWFAEPSRGAYVAAAADLAFERTVTFLRAALGAPSG